MKTSRGMWVGEMMEVVAATKLKIICVCRFGGRREEEITSGTRDKWQATVSGNAMRKGSADRAKEPSESGGEEANAHEVGKEEGRRSNLDESQPAKKLLGNYLSDSIASQPQTRQMGCRTVESMASKRGQKGSQ